ncbi:MAG: hypothetical protein WAK12_07320, partial [Acidimicrobiales bacterium]
PTAALAHLVDRKHVRAKPGLAPRGPLTSAERRPKMTNALQPTPMAPNGRPIPKGHREALVTQTSVAQSPRDRIESRVGTHGPTERALRVVGRLATRGLREVRVTEMVEPRGPRDRIESRVTRRPPSAHRHEALRLGRRLFDLQQSVHQSP